MSKLQVDEPGDGSSEEDAIVQSEDNSGSNEGQVINEGDECTLVVVSNGECQECTGTYDSDLACVHDVEEDGACETVDCESDNE